MLSCHLDLLCSVDVGQESKTESLRVGRVGEAIHCEGGLGGVERLADTRIQLVVGNTAPESRLGVCYGLCVWREENKSLVPLIISIKSSKCIISLLMAYT